MSDPKQPGNKRDAKQPGLIRRIRESGHECWYFRYSLHNRVYWYRIGQVGVDKARQIARRLAGQVADGKNPQAERLAQRKAGTFGELADRYLKERAKRYNKSWRQGRALIERFILPRWARLTATSITQADVYAALNEIDKDSVLNQTLAATSAIFTWGVKVKVLPFNPVVGVEGRPTTKARKRVLGDSEIALFWPHLTPMLKTILLTGQRPGEVSHMTHLHIRDGVWEQPGEPMPALGWPGTKNAEFHRVFLPTYVRELIASTVPNGTATASGFVFKRDRASRLMRNICRRLGVAEKVTPRDLRRTWTTTAARLGANRQALQRVLNHRDKSVTADHYDQYRYEREDAALMEAVARHILDLAEGRRGTGTVVLGRFGQ